MSDTPAGSTPNKPPAFQMYARDWLVDITAGMPLEAQGACMRLFCHQWIEGPMPMNIAALAQRAGLQPRPFLKLWNDYLKAHFPDIGHGLVANSWLEDRRRDREAYVEKQRKNGRLGGRPRKGEKTHGFPDENPPVSSGFPKSKPRENPTVNPDETQRVTQKKPLQSASASAVSDSVPNGTGAMPQWNATAAGHLRAICYRPDGKEPAESSIAEDLKWWRRCLDHGMTEGRILAALNGLPRIMQVAQKWSPARVFGKVGNWVNLFERAVTEDGKHGRPEHLAHTLERLGARPRETA